jgi:DNA replication ATP-dependent helicase Dna2
MPPNKKAPPAKSRLGLKSDATVGNGQGILQFFDKKPVHRPAATETGTALVTGSACAPVLQNRDEHQKENLAVQQQRVQKLAAGEEVDEKRVMHARGERLGSKPGSGFKHLSKKSTLHMEMILAEEYGNCSSQDILLGNTDALGNVDGLAGKVVWTASPGKGILSTEDPEKDMSQYHQKGRSMGNKQRIKAEKIEPVMLPAENNTGSELEPDVFDALSTALNNTDSARRESLGFLGTPLAGVDVKGTLGALKQCCDDMQLESPESTKTKRTKRARRTIVRRGVVDCGYKHEIVKDAEYLVQVCEPHTDRGPERGIQGGPLVDAKVEGTVTVARVEVGAVNHDIKADPSGENHMAVGEVISKNTTTLKWGDTDSDEDNDGLEWLLTGLDKLADSVATSSTLKREDATAKQPNHIGPELHLTNRYLVTSCGSDGRWPVIGLRRRDGRVLHVHMQSPWDIGDYRPGDSVNLIGAHEYAVGDETHCELGMGQPGFLVQFPELLLGSTRVTSSSECPRRGYLQEKIVSGDGGSSPAQIYGQMYHQMIQSAMLHGHRKGSELFQQIPAIVESMPEALLDANITTHDAIAWLKEKVPATLSFLNKFLRQDPTAVNVCQVAAASTGQQTARSCITKVEEIEDYFVSPTYGLKGYIDVTTSLKSATVNPSANCSNEQRFVTSLGPFEIKTGNSRASDTAQVLLYLLALEEKYGTEVPHGMLFYLKERNPTIVERNDALLSCLLATRNTVATSLVRTELPPMTHMKSSCLRCWDRSTCALVHASRSRGTAEQFVEGLPQGTTDHKRLKDFYELEVGHLSDRDKEFLAEWDRLLDLEAVASNASRGEIWTVPAAERERMGRCVGSLTLCSATKADFATRGNNHVNTLGMVYTFAKSNGHKIFGSSIAFGEPVLLSIEGGPLGVSKGHVLSMSREEIVVHTDKPIRTKCLERRASPELAGRPLVELDLTWKIDKEEVGTTVPRMRGFLYDLFGHMDHPEINVRRQRLRRLIVDLEHPGPPLKVDDLTEAERRIVAHHATEMSMNAEQEQALNLAFAQPGYLLVLGVPGAGKTTAIVGMIKALASAGKRVLLVSYTNAAVDHVLLKLAAGGFDNFLRLGRKGRVNSRLGEFLPTGDRYNAATSEDMIRLMQQIPVVGVSALGVTDTLLRQCDFDVCIVDEAGQITLPSVLGALLRADKFILVGDHNQLPPLVQSSDAEEQGLDTPLFARLAKAHPSMVVTLSRQYRMSEEIQSISNKFVYAGALCCGTEDVARSRLNVDPTFLSALQAVDPWMHRVLVPDTPVLFIDTSSMPHKFMEHSVGDITENHGEADLAIAIADAAIGLSVPGDDVAIISPYRSQVALISEKLRTRQKDDTGVDQTGTMSTYECLTIDKAQGRDKAMVIVSLVKSNDRQDPGKLLGDIRRVNVAMTRAQSKLLLIGDSSTLINLELFAGIIRFMKDSNWVIPAAATAVMHRNNR